MKKIIVFISTLVPFIALGQSTDQNYIKSKTYKEASTASISNPTPAQATQSITYFDGLGRPIQQIAHKQSGVGNDFVTHIEYDAFGRQVKEYLPIVDGQTLNYHSIDNSTVAGYYSTPAFPGMEITTNPYSEKLLESSPLNRVLKQAAPGNAWALGSGHEVKFDYQTNGVEEVRLFQVSLQSDYTPNVIDNRIYYEEDKLYKTITKDENWISGNDNTTEEFKDKEGKIVLKRTFGVSIVDEVAINVAHDTFYVYDDYGNLTFVIPPLVDVSQTLDSSVLDGLCYQYKYDYRNRLIEKKLPGKQREYIAYNSQDMPVATGPVKNPWGYNTWGWLINKYDALGRIVYTGWVGCTDFPGDRVTIEANLNNGGWFENFTSAPTTIDDIPVSYTNQTEPLNLKLLNVNYYDNYSYVNAPTLPTTVEDEPVLTNVKSLATGNWVRILDNPGNTTAEVSYTLYDRKGRVIRTCKSNYLGGYTTMDSKLDFTGKPIFTTTYHKRDVVSNEIVVGDTYEYTPQDRLFSYNHVINGGDRELIAKNDYDDLGQLIIKQVGGEDVTTYVGLQKVNFGYNIRGWLKTINHVDDLQQPNDPTDLFAFKINYNTIENDVNQQVKALYNGNISETFWRSSTDNVQRKYGYQYDNLNRLTNSFYQKPNRTVPITNMYNEEVSYDKNGNIQTMKRNGDYDSDYYGAIQIDNLSYAYDPDIKNQLLKVTDATNSPKGFRDDIDCTTDICDDYTYDDNGNMIADQNKNISSILYNHLNLPTQINFGTGDKIEYLYDAIGQKKSKKVTEGVNETITDYLDGYQYTNTILNFFPHAEGYVNVAYCPTCQTEYQTRFNYVYQYKDHLGNIRLSYGYDQKDQVTKVIEENHYYPFGLKHTKYNSGKTKYGPDEEFQELMKLRQIPAGEQVLHNYKFQGQERQDELGLNWDSFKWRNYDYAIGRFMSIDPLAEDYNYQSPYNFAENQVISGFELEGLEKVDAQFGLKLNLNIGTNGINVNASTSIGVSSKIGAFQPSANLSATFYNGGLGTTSMARGFQRDIVASGAVTVGGGNASPISLNTFNPNTATGVENTFKNSGTVGTNFVLNSSGRNQQVAFAGARFGDVSFGTHNDFQGASKIGLSDGQDRFHTGGGFLSFGTNDSSFQGTLSFNVFTAMTDINDGLNSSSFTQELFGGTPVNVNSFSLNQGSSSFSFRTGNFTGGFSTLGKSSMFSQNAIHKAIDFHLIPSTTKDTYNASGGVQF